MVPPDHSDPQTTVVSSGFDPSVDDPITVHVVQVVAAASNRAPNDLPPLGKTVDVDALEALLDSNNADLEAALEISFEYEDYRVHIESTGIISLHERTE